MPHHWYIDRWWQVMAGPYDFFLYTGFTCCVCKYYLGYSVFNQNIVHLFHKIVVCVSIAGLHYALWLAPCPIFRDLISLTRSLVRW